MTLEVMTAVVIGVALAHQALRVREAMRPWLEYELSGSRGPGSSSGGGAELAALAAAGRVDPWNSSNLPEGHRSN